MKRKTCIFKNVAMLFIAIGLLAVFVGCNDKNDEVGPLREEVQTLRSELTKSFDSKVDAKTKELQDQLDQAKKQIADLSKRREGMSPEELQAKIDEATENLITVTAAQAMYEEYVKEVKALLAGAETSGELEALKSEIKGLDTEIGKVRTDLTTELGSTNQKIALLETLVGENKKDLDAALVKLKAEFAGEFTKFTNSFDQAVKDLDKKIDSQRTDLEKLLKGYKEANDKLAKAIEKNEKAAGKNAVDITNLTSDVAKLREDITTLDGKLKDAQKALNLNILDTILNSRLTSLVFLPDYVGEGGSLPLMIFSPISTPCDDVEIDPVVEVKYMVSPSTVTKKDIDINNLKFVYNDPVNLYRKDKSQAELVAPKAEFVSLENGILTVRATLNSSETWSTKGGRRIDQLMLQVPSAKQKDKQQFVVSSDWARVISKPISGYKLGKQDVDGQNTKFLPTTLAEAMDKDNAPVVDLEYNGSLDLNTFVKTIYGSSSVLNIKNYGLTYAYDLKDSEGKTIVYELGDNKTDQQKFIKLNGSTVTTRVYDIDGKNPASVDRTPIVRVLLKSDKCDKNLKEAFIKINIVKSKGKDNIKPVDFANDKEIVASCEDFSLRVGTQEMNEKFYAKAELSKQEFHRAYTLQDDPEDKDGVGTVSQVKDDEDQESYNLLWKVTSNDIWNALGTGKKAVNKKEISKVVEYRSGNNVIKVTFKATVNRPSIDLSNVKLDNYWSTDKKYVRFNIAVPEKGSKDSSLAVIKTDIDNIFDNVKDGSDIVIKGWNDKYIYNYTFVEKQPLQAVPYGEDELIKLIGEGSILYAQRYNKESKEDIGDKKKVAEILSSDNTIVYNESSALAKYLLNRTPDFVRAELQMNVTDKCTHTIEANISNGNRFMVHFLRPVNVEEIANKHFVDAVDEGSKGSVLNITDIVVLSDWRRNVTGSKNFNFEPNNKNYYKYYGVTSIDIDEANIKVKGLNGNNNLVAKPGSIDVKQVGPVDIANNKFGQVTYHNNQATLNKAFELHIPVVVTYKWGEVKTTVKVNVKPTSEASRKRVK